MKTLSRNIAIVTVAFGVSALAMTPIIASASENGTYSSNVPNNSAGAHGARKTGDIRLAQQAKTAQPKPKSPAMKADFSQQGETVLQQVHQARVALSNGKYETALKLIHDARATLANMYNSGASGNIVISGPVIFNQDVSADNQVNKAAQISQVILPFDETRGNIDLAYTQMINSRPFRANQTLRLVEKDLSVQTAQFTTSSTVTPTHS